HPRSVVRFALVRPASIQSAGPLLLWRHKKSRCAPRKSLRKRGPMGIWREWLGRQDSNLGWRDQNPLPYRLATPQCAAREIEGKGGGCNACDGVGGGEALLSISRAAAAGGCAIRYRGRHGRSGAAPRSPGS